MKGVAVVFVVVLVVVSLAATPGEAVSCGELQSSLAPCLSYLTGGGEPSESCCGGLRSASGSIQSTQDRQTACYCMKSAASCTYNVPTDAAASLPGKCGVSVGMTISPNVDCSQIS
ncbi:hypothetical protein MIMGU_mgv1a025606mg [Erythranthe guttata]|uniref:Non-specific lipid-transfer protein n=1 Tax=Erythranthe guttata TaxID=4155 RepID=A0A022RP64_ERYGU|nr:PREDICTED: non-specific lipid-transfer protein 1-like [Erythranthe guttata]EYU40720.1 hypothetical protein MIMGU_mgv1a025606mg [Erythranthe guttata]|eukprot:XP_012833365.1 PREDICTED: non-specific lipid-transfer protein 1-like [Erythranthe guttata]